MLRPDSAKLRTRKAYIAWAVAGYVKGYGLAAADARACAEIDWGLCLEAQAEAARPPAERLGKVLERKRACKVQEMFNSPITRPDQRPPRKAAPKAKPKPKPMLKPKPKPKVLDFRGVEFNSFTEMCGRWGVEPDTVHTRLARGWSLERALRTPPVGKRKEAEDHRGNKYPSIKDMCKAYGIRDATWRSRRRAGWSVERALETPEYPKSIPARDADGNCYKSIKAMAGAYGLPRSTLNARLNRGMALEMALMAPVIRKEEGK